MNERKLDFESFNIAFDKLMGVGEFFEDAILAATLADDNARERPPVQSELLGEGRLIVQASTASQAVPIMDAKATISQSTGEVIAVQRTDNSGRTPGIALPAPSARLSQTPSNTRPYSTYNIRIESPGYYTQELLNVAVFDKIESIQPVALEPIGEQSLENDRVMANERGM